MKKNRGVSIAVLLFVLNGLFLSCGFFYLLKQNILSVREVTEKQTEENLRIFGRSFVNAVAEWIDDDKNVDSFLKKFDFGEEEEFFSGNAENFEGSFEGSFEENFKENFEGKEFRITVVAPDGVVAGDSEVDNIHLLENHKNREEIAAALSGKEGSAVRKSTVSKDSVMYYALPVQTKKGIYAVRLSVPLSMAVYFPANSKKQIAKTMLAVFVVIAFLTFLVSAYIVHQIKKLEILSGEYKNGNFDAKSTVSGPKELRKLGNRMEVMATELKRLEQVRKDFVSNVSHELKTPVTSISGFTETLLDGAIEDRDTALHFLQIINVQCMRLMAIIEDLLTLSRLEKDNKKPETMRRDVLNVVRQVCARFRDKAAAKNIRVLYSEETGERGRVQSVFCMLNEGLFDEALGNLIDNAIKYCPEKTEVECKVKFIASKNMVQISVEDNGAGIPKEFRERIFERFYRIDKGRSRDMGGTGLGLSIAAHIIKAHDGKLYVTDRPDKKQGACFVIELPVISISE